MYSLTQVIPALDLGYLLDARLQQTNDRVIVPVACRERAFTMRLLIVDDHEIVRKAVSVILSRRKDLEGCIEAGNGREAIEKSLEGKPDAIIMDVSMPVMDGFTAAREIRKFSPDVPIIFLSIHSGREAIEQAKLAGGQAYVKKMEASSELPKALDAVLQEKQYFPQFTTNG